MKQNNGSAARAGTGQGNVSEDRMVREIPEQEPVRWRIAFMVSWRAMRRRLVRSMITMLGVILAVAFLTYMLVTNGITLALVLAGDEELNLLLQVAGVDIFSAGKIDQMMILLIGLSLFTCLVGIVNSMLMSVTERISEIGTIKCLGARDSFIVKTYFIESSLQGIFGTFIGILLGLLMAIIIATVDYGKYALLYLPVTQVFRSAAVAFAAGSLLSVAASIGPAYAAAKKQPVEAMRVEE